MDDYRFWTSLLPLGARWNKERKQFQLNPDWAKKNREEGKSREQVKARALREIMNGIAKDISMTTELARDFEDGWLPTLDCKMRLIKPGDRGPPRTEYRFFRKPTTPDIVLMERSAMPVNIRQGTLAQEIIRRMRHCCKRTPM